MRTRRSQPPKPHTSLQTLYSYQQWHLFLFSFFFPFLLTLAQFLLIWLFDNLPYTRSLARSLSYHVTATVPTRAACMRHMKPLCLGGSIPGHSTCQSALGQNNEPQIAPDWCVCESGWMRKALCRTVKVKRCCKCRPFTLLGEYPTLVLVSVHQYL